MGDIRQGRERGRGSQAAEDVGREAVNLTIERQCLGSCTLTVADAVCERGAVPGERKRGNGGGEDAIVALRRGLGHLRPVAVMS